MRNLAFITSTLHFLTYKFQHTHKTVSELLNHTPTKNIFTDQSLSLPYSIFHSYLYQFLTSPLHSMWVCYSFVMQLSSLVSVCIQFLFPTASRLVLNVCLFQGTCEYYQGLLKLLLFPPKHSCFKIVVYEKISFIKWSFSISLIMFCFN